MIDDVVKKNIRKSNKTGYMKTKYNKYFGN